MLTSLQLLTPISVILATLDLHYEPNQLSKSMSVISMKYMTLITISVRSGLGCTSCLRKLGELDEESKVKLETREVKNDIQQPCYYMTSISRNKCVPCCQTGGSCIEV